jgi:predicted AlkP superfamily phosphohydrolase/phosphomutase
MKALFLAIDALDCLLLDELADMLPNFSRLRTEGTSLAVRSTFPPDSDTAWATIVTGLNPAQHGIVRFIDPLEKSFQLLTDEDANESLRGRTFWEKLDRDGCKTCVLFPHMGYPLWQTSGLMVVRGKNGDVQANRADILDRYPDPQIQGGVIGFPGRGEKGLREHAHKLTRLAEADAEFGIRLLTQVEWDLFFIYWSTIDAIGHFFWSYFDPDDPGCVDGHDLAGMIPQTYRQYDRIVGRFLAAVDQDVTVIVMSDHGHGIRPFKLININEILRRAGLLAVHAASSKPQVAALEKAKRAVALAVSRLGLGKSAATVLRNIPRLVQAFTRPANIDWDRTIAYASDMSGIKSYTYGGVNINGSGLTRSDYERVRSEILELLRAGCVLPDGTCALRFALRREELYSGPYLSKYPDVVLELEYGYGLGWAAQGALMSRAPAHNVVPGSHRGATGTFLMRSSRQAVRDPIDLLDVSPTLLDLMGVATQEPCEGKTILAQAA